MSRQTANHPQSPFYKGGGAATGEGLRHHFFVKPDPPYVEPERRPLRALKAAEEEAIARRRAAVYEHMPDMLPFFKDLHEAGMIEGWRGVGEVVVHASTGSARTDL